MDLGKPKADRELQGLPLALILRRLAARVATETGDSELRALAEIRLAAEKAITDTLKPQLLLDEALGDNPSWRTIGAALGVSAQAAHRKYRITARS